MATADRVTNWVIKVDLTEVNEALERLKQAMLQVSEALREARVQMIELHDRSGLHEPPNDDPSCAICQMRAEAQSVARAEERMRS